MGGVLPLPAEGDGAMGRMKEQPSPRQGAVSDGNNAPTRGISSAGRALRSHRRGQGFESPILHSPTGLPWAPLPAVGATPNRDPPLPLRLSAAMAWTDEAEQLLREVPFFVRPAVRRRIEKLAGEAGLAEVDGDFYLKARASFGRKQSGDDVKG